MATLHHWGLPQALQDRGGWANRETAYHFATYAKTMYERLGGRVKKWVTLNEPIVVADFSHLRGWRAPGIRSHAINARVTHHLVLAHGLATRAFREPGTPGVIGITNANTAYEAIGDSPAAIRAQELARDFDSRVFHGPVYGRGYPASVLKHYAELGAPFPVEDGDMRIIATPTDFLGVNNYSRAVVEPVDGPMGFRPAQPTLPVQPMGYEEAPHSLGDFDGAVEELLNDQKRVQLLRGFLEGLSAAIAEGADVRGCYVWSLMDNFEWAFGYTMRFGICYTNYETLERKPKASARFYSEVIRRNGF